MKTEAFEGTVSSAYGEKFAKAIKFNGTFEAVENTEEIPEREKPNSQDLIDLVNLRRKNNERQKAMIAALEAAGIYKPDPNDPIVVAKGMIRNVLAMENMPEQQKQVMLAVLKQQIADEEKRRSEAEAKAAEAAPQTVA